MGWTKRQFIEEAFNSIGMASFLYDLQPEQLQSALRKLDSMMGMWDSKNIKIGYPISAIPNNSDIDENTNVLDASNEAIYLNLAIRIAPGFGKVVGTDTKDLAKYAYKELLNKTAKVYQMQLPSGTPLGAGNKTWRNASPFVNKPDEDPLQIGDDHNLEFR